MEKSAKKLKLKFPASGATALPLSNGAPMPRIDKGIHYYLYHPEFCHWLIEKRTLHWDDVSPAMRKASFLEFAQDWNEGLLSEKYYEGVSRMFVPRAKSQFGTEAAGDGKAGPTLEERRKELEDDQEQREANREKNRAEKKRIWKEQKEWLEDNFPKATGKDVLQEKRAARREEAKARDYSPDAGVVPGSSFGNIMGGDDSFAAAKAREQKRKAWRNLNRDEAKGGGNAEFEQKLKAYRDKEDKKIADLKALIGNRGFTIQKRHD